MNSNSYTEKRFANNVMKLAGGSMVAQVFGIAVSPIITRLFAPEAMGIMALFISISSVLGVISCLRYELSIVLPADEKDSANLFASSLIITALLSAIILICVAVFGECFSALTNTEELNNYLWLLPISVFLQGGFLAFNYWSTRSKHFGRLSLARVASSLVNNLSKLSLGFVGFVNAGTLICAYIIGQIISFVFLGAPIFKKNYSLFKSTISLSRMAENLSRYRQFPQFSTWTALLNSASVNIPAWILAIFFSPVVVGFYAICRIFLAMPMQFIGSAIAQVFFQQATELKNTNGNLSATVEKVFTTLVLLSLFPVLMLMLTGEELFALVFGQRWAEAGFYAQILSPWIFVVFISSPLSNLFNVLEKQHIGLIFDTLLFSSRLVSLIVGGLLNDVYLALALFSGSGFLVWTGICFWLLNSSGVSKIRVMNKIMKYVLFCLPFVIFEAFIKWQLQVNTLVLITSMGIGILLYYSFVLANDESMKKQLLYIFNKFNFSPMKVSEK
ncbi:MAG: oligosaccharide flippase family protein [Deltaproteobacteria bacterium]|nr:oligosaccharide flippase family protein [Deltaproteobacteria bacterium]